MASTEQLSTWTSRFGREYTDRNTMSVDEMDGAFKRQFGIRKSEMYRELVGPSRIAEGRVLEVGCNIGLQLALFDRANPGLDLHGLEPQEYAIARARQLAPERHFHQGSAFALPFADGSFDLVMTNGVLIHIAPGDLPDALNEIHRVAKRFIWCHEYYAPATTEVRYHGQSGLLWKTNFAERYRELFPTLRELAVRYYPYQESSDGADLVDQVVLFEKVAE
jgi:pseudaminic acid biosynthesis-associated methylase